MISSSLLSSAPSAPSSIISAHPRTGAKAVATAAQDFESYVASEFLEHMFSGIEADPLFGGGEGEQVYRSFLIQEYGKSIAASGALGISAIVQRELLRTQEQEQQT